MNKFAFLFFRFRPGGHSYMMVLLLRNIFVAAVPIIDEPASELFGSCTQLLFVLLICGTADESCRRRRGWELASGLLADALSILLLTWLFRPSYVG